MPVKNRIQLRRGTTQQWNEGGDILGSGEPGFDTQNNILKIGNGSTSWSGLTPIGYVSSTGNFDRIIFNNVGDPNLDEAELAWNNSEGSLAIGVSDTHSIFIGEEMLYRVRNNTGSTILAGTPVYATGLTPGGNNRIEIAPYTADGAVREIRFMGLMMEDCDSGINGYATHFGYIRGIDTRGGVVTDYSDKLWVSGEPAWSEGDILYVHPTVTGKLTKTEPKHSISVAMVLNRHQSQGKLFVRPTSYGHLDDNHDVNTNGVSDKQYLIYNSGTDLWTPTSSGIFSKTYTNELFMTPSEENISASHLKLYQYPDQPTSLLQLNQSNLQIIGVSGSSLSPQNPTKYPQISFNKLSYVDFNRSAIRLTACETTGGNTGPSWPTVTGVSSQAMSSGIFFEDRLWKPSSYNPANGFAYDATSQIVSTPSNTVAGYTKLSFLVQTASGVVNPNNGTVPPGSYVERFYIGSDGITNVNGTIRANQGEMDSLVLDEGGLTVNRGIIQVNNSFDNNFVMMINSSGLNISASYEFITDYADSANVVTPVQLFDAPSITPSTITVFFDGLTEEDLTVNKTVLIRSASNSIKNGIYIIAAGSAANTIRFNRHPSYPNGSTVKNGKVFGVRSNGGSYVLNIQLPLNEDRVINTDTLDFSPFGGSRAVTFTANADAAFSAAVYAKEKYFRIQHPDPESSYEYLQYGSLESPYHGVRLTGEGELKNGTCIIKLPTYLKHLIHEKDINIQLTNKGHHKILYLDKIDLKNDRFIVKGYRSKTGGPFAFFWCFTGVRKDVDPLIPEY